MQSKFRIEILNPTHLVNICKKLEAAGYKLNYQTAQETTWVYIDKVAKSYEIIHHALLESQEAYELTTLEGLEDLA